MTELLAAALLDMAWHQRQGEDPVSDVAAFEAAALAQANIELPYVPPRYRSSYFQHIWGGGYAANGRRFRAMILSRGNSQDLQQLYRDWRGKDPAISAMLKHRGLAED